MANNNGPTIGLPASAPAAADHSAHNAEIAAKLAAQDAMGHSSAPQFSSDADSALDKLAALVPDPAKPVEPAAPAPPDPNDAEAVKKAEEAAAAAVKVAEEAAAQKAADDEALKRADEALFKGAPQLAPNASQKSADAFRDIKIRAVRELAALQTKLAEAEAKLAELAKQTGQPTKEQLEMAEKLKDHEKWRAKLDVEADPRYKEFDSTIKNAQDFIYAQLKQHSAVTDAVIVEIKKYGGPEKVKLDKIFTAIGDEQTITLVKAKLADIAVANYNKNQAIESAKQNIDQYIQEKSTETAKQTEIYQGETRKELDGLMNALDWTKPRKVEANATAEDKKAAETHNAFVEQTKAQLEEGIKNDNPKLRATLLTGIAQLFNLQRVHESLKNSYAAAEKELKELRDWKDRVKKAGTSRLQESNAPTSGPLPAAKPANQFTTPAVDALDVLAKQVTQERAAKLGQAA